MYIRTNGNTMFNITKIRESKIFNHAELAKQNRKKINTYFWSPISVSKAVYFWFVSSDFV